LTLFALEAFSWFQYFEFFKQANFATHFADIELEWAGITSLMAEIMDPAREESLSTSCLQPDRYIRISLAKQPLRVPIDSFLPAQSLKIIEARALADLNQVYHNLTAENDLQRVSLI
jgi:hypothetical protein